MTCQETYNYEPEIDIKRRTSLDSDTKPDPGEHCKQRRKAQKLAMTTGKVQKHQSSDPPGRSREEKLWGERKK